MAPQAGFEPATLRLTAGCSAVELLRNRWARDVRPVAPSGASRASHGTEISGKASNLRRSAAPQPGTIVIEAKERDDVRNILLALDVAAHPAALRHYVMPLGASI